MSKYKRIEKESEVKKILSDPRLSPDQKIAQSLLYLEKYIYDLEDSAQEAIFKIDEDLKKSNASSRVSM